MSDQAADQKLMMRSRLALSLQPIEENDDVASSSMVSSKHEGNRQEASSGDVRASTSKNRGHEENADDHTLNEPVLKTTDSEEEEKADMTLPLTKVIDGLPSRMQKQWSVGVDGDVCTPANKGATLFMPLNTMSA